MGEKAIQAVLSGIIIVLIVMAVYTLAFQEEPVGDVICNQEFTVGKTYSINGNHYILESMDIDTWSYGDTASLMFSSKK